MATVHETTVNTRAIENGFPIGFISRLAEHESWRKEVYRPLYYIHKWWARRLGSVFRAIILGSCLEKTQDVESYFYEPTQLSHVTVFDPFMGSGTTIGEAVKLGCRVIGRDINPVSLIMVSTALQVYSMCEVRDTFDHISKTAGEKIRSFYSIKLSNGERAEVLYYFWVKIIPCPLCGHEVELFKTRVFSKNATPKKHPEAKAVCPNCKTINEVRYDAKKATCHICTTTYNPQIGTVVNKKITCPSCNSNFSVISAVRKLTYPPRHKIYAKMILTESGKKTYLPGDEQDNASYEAAASLLNELWGEIPDIEIQSGYNTNQILNYNYKCWHELFNARQLVCFALLSAEICKIEKPELRTLFACLLSSALEFNNLFCSFKGEGTGAVRPIFAHHILKPELAPLEANVWGTPKSSGSFSTLFESRILRALEYKAKPFEFRVTGANEKKQNQKVFGLSCPIDATIVDNYQKFVSNNSVYLSVGDSSKTDLPNESVDFVITDPPFFDNVHYSQLADFFYVWLQHILRTDEFTKSTTTRSSHEVQDTDVDKFANKLIAVFKECHRVLKADGLFVFTYHHSRIDGWVALYKAIRESGFYVTHAHPVKSEMAVAIPIQQSKIPINFDLIIVCRKNNPANLPTQSDSISTLICLDETRQIVKELQSLSMPVLAGDIKVIFLGCVLSKLSLISNLSQEIEFLQNIERKSETLIKEILAYQLPPESSVTPYQQSFWRQILC
jgi:adenine-specific DNA methylase